MHRVWEAFSKEGGYEWDSAHGRGQRDSVSRKPCSAPRLLLPDPVHHERGAVLEDAEVFLLHALRGIQEQVEVQVTRSLDLDFSAHAFWQKCGRGGFRFHL